MRRFVSFFLFVFSFSLCAVAEKVDLQRAKEYAFMFMRELVDDLQIDDLRYESEDGQHNVYVFNLSDDRGFILLSNNDVARPVVAYSTTGSFLFSELPDVTRSFISAYDLALDSVAEGQPNEEWIKPTIVDCSLRASTNHVEPLIKTHWHQHKIYATCFPDNETNGQSVAGCVAVAISQVMKYWGYPSVGFGSKSLESPYYGVLNVDFSTHHYDYSLMPESLTETSTAEEVTSVSSLLYDVAVASHSILGNSKQGTGARLFISNNFPKENGQYGMLNYFGYSPTMKAVARNSYTPSRWLLLLKNELKAGRPVLYSGSDESGQSGHCFILDGYDANNYMHVEWGWGGSADGYYLIDSMIPSQNMDFSYSQCALIGITPPQSYFDSLGTGVNDVAVLDMPVVFPSKVDDKLIVNVKDARDNACRYMLYDISGKLVFSGAVLGDKASIDMSDVSSGIYVFEIICGTNKKKFKILKE